MKPRIITIGFTIAAAVPAFAFARGVSAAQDKTQATTMGNVTVNEVPQYETYVADLGAGFTLQALVGHSHRQFVEARRAAGRLESQRKQGMATQPLVAVAIDNSLAPGVAKQFQLIDADNRTIAVVNLYCKRAVPSGGPHCRLTPLGGQSLAATQAEYLRVAEAELKD